jgi:hypothetical protein
MRRWFFVRPVWRLYPHEALEVLCSCGYHVIRRVPMTVPVNLQDVLELVQRLSTVDKVRLIERVSPQIEAEIAGRERGPRRSAWGLCRDLGEAPSAETIDETRREMLDVAPAVRLRPHHA